MPLKFEIITTLKTELIYSMYYVDIKFYIVYKYN